MDATSENESIFYRGAGGSLHVASRRASSSRESSIDLSGDEREWLQHQSFHREILTSALRSNLLDNTRRGDQAGPHRIASSTAQLGGFASAPYPHIPLYGYYCDVQRHEEIAVGITSDHRAKKQMYELCNSRLNASTLLVGSWVADDGSSASYSSGSVTSSASSSSARLENRADDTFEELSRLYSSPEWHSLSPEEQQMCLHRMQKLRRRIRNDEKPRKLKSARLRKRTKASHTSQLKSDG